MTLEERARAYGQAYDVVDLDLRGELERTELGWTSKPDAFERLVKKVVELVRIAAQHGYEEGGQSVIAEVREKLLAMALIGVEEDVNGCFTNETLRGTAVEWGEIEDILKECEGE